jgi:hypothetical protein
VQVLGHCLGIRGQEEEAEVADMLVYAFCSSFGDIDTRGRGAGIGTSVWASGIGMLNDGRRGVRVRGHLFGTFHLSFDNVKATERSVGAVVSIGDPDIK